MILFKALLRIILLVLDSFETVFSAVDLFTKLSTSHDTPISLPHIWTLLGVDAVSVFMLQIGVSVLIFIIFLQDRDRANRDYWLHIWWILMISTVSLCILYLLGYSQRGALAVSGIITSAVVLPFVHRTLGKKWFAKTDWAKDFYKRDSVIIAANCVLAWISHLIFIRTFMAIHLVPTEMGNFIIWVLLGTISSYIVLTIIALVVGVDFWPYLDGDT